MSETEHEAADATEAELPDIVGMSTAIQLMGLPDHQHSPAVIRWLCTQDAASALDDVEGLPLQPVVPGTETYRTRDIQRIRDQVCLVDATFVTRETGRPPGSAHWCLTGGGRRHYKVPTAGVRRGWGYRIWCRLEDVPDMVVLDG